MMKRIIGLLAFMLVTAVFYQCKDCTEMEADCDAGSCDDLIEARADGECQADPNDNSSTTTSSSSTNTCSITARDWEVSNLVFEDDLSTLDLSDSEATIAFSLDVTNTSSCSKTLAGATSNSSTGQPNADGLYLFIWVLAEEATDPDATALFDPAGGIQWVTAVSTPVTLDADGTTTLGPVGMSAGVLDLDNFNPAWNYYLFVRLVDATDGTDAETVTGDNSIGSAATHPITFTNAPDRQYAWLSVKTLNGQDNTTNNNIEPRISCRIFSDDFLTRYAQGGSSNSDGSATGGNNANGFDQVIGAAGDTDSADSVWMWKSTGTGWFDGLDTTTTTIQNGNPMGKFLINHRNTLSFLNEFFYYGSITNQMWFQDDGYAYLGDYVFFGFLAGTEIIGSFGMDFHEDGVVQPFTPNTLVGLESGQSYYVRCEPARGTVNMSLDDPSDPATDNPRTDQDTPDLGGRYPFTYVIGLNYADPSALTNPWGDLPAPSGADNPCASSSNAINSNPVTRAAVADVCGENTTTANQSIAQNLRVFSDGTIKSEDGNDDLTADVTLTDGSAITNSFCYEDGTSTICDNFPVNEQSLVHWYKITIP